MTPKDTQEWNDYLAKQAADVAQRDEPEKEFTKQLFAFTISWADLMENAFQAGQPIERCGERTSLKADRTHTQGMTMMMFQFAVRILVSQWKHGEALRVWHNRRFGVEDDDEHGQTGLVDCASFDLPMGRVALIALYQDVMKTFDGHRSLVEKGSAQAMLAEIKKFYQQRGIPA
jgi:hypothetical protein